MGIESRQCQHGGCLKPRMDDSEYCRHHQLGCGVDGCTARTRSGWCAKHTKRTNRRAEAKKCKQEFCQHGALPNTDFCCYHRYNCRTVGCFNRVEIQGHFCVDCKEIKAAHKAGDLEMQIELEDSHRRAQVVERLKSSERELQEMLTQYLDMTKHKTSIGRTAKERLPQIENQLSSVRQQINRYLGQ